MTLPTGLTPLVTVLKTHYVQKKQELPDAWCRTLLSEGRVSEMIELDSSAKAALGPVVDRHLRAARVVHFAGLPIEKTNSYFFEGIWSKPEIVKAGVAAYVDLHAAKESGLTLPGLEDASQRLALKLSTTMDHVLVGLKGYRESRCTMWETLREVLAETESKKVASLIEALDDKELDKNTEGL